MSADLPPPPAALRMPDSVPESSVMAAASAEEPGIPGWVASEMPPPPPAVPDLQGQIVSDIGIDGGLDSDAASLNRRGSNREFNWAGDEVQMNRGGTHLEINRGLDRPGIDRGSSPFRSDIPGVVSEPMGFDDAGERRSLFDDEFDAGPSVAPLPAPPEFESAGFDSGLSESAGFDSGLSESAGFDSGLAQSGLSDLPAPPGFESAGFDSESSDLPAAPEFESGLVDRPLPPQVGDSELSDSPAWLAAADEADRQAVPEPPVPSHWTSDPDHIETTTQSGLVESGLAELPAPPEFAPPSLESGLAELPAPPSLESGLADLPAPPSLESGLAESGLAELPAPPEFAPPSLESGLADSGLADLPAPPGLESGLVESGLAELPAPPEFAPPSLDSGLADLPAPPEFDSPGFDSGLAESGLAEPGLAELPEVPMMNDGAEMFDVVANDVAHLDNGDLEPGSHLLEPAEEPNKDADLDHVGMLTAPAPNPPAAADSIPTSGLASGAPVDPHNFAAVAPLLPAATQRRAKAALIATATYLEPNERVQAMVAGQYLSHDGIAIVTEHRVLFGNGRTFAPEVHAVVLTDVTDVKGWARDGRATVRVTTAQAEMVLGDIGEISLAQAFAVVVRAKI